MTLAAQLDRHAWTAVGRTSRRSIGRTVSIVRAAVVLVLFEEASFPAGRPRSHVGAWIGLEFVNILGKFAQHARA